jgi:hypothetical protein
VSWVSSNTQRWRGERGTQHDPCLLGGVGGCSVPLLKAPRASSQRERGGYLSRRVPPSASIGVSGMAEGPLDLPEWGRLSSESEALCARQVSSCRASTVFVSALNLCPEAYKSYLCTDTGGFQLSPKGDSLIVGGSLPYGVKDAEMYVSLPSPPSYLDIHTAGSSPRLAPPKSPSYK